MSKYRITAQGDGFWQICDDFVYMYLLSNGIDALLVDTGFGDHDLWTFVTSLAGCEPKVILTHAHGDHCGGARQFTEIMAGAKDLDAIDPENILRRKNLLKPAKVGCQTVNTLGQIEILPLPGHTPGSLGILDREHRRFFIGDYLSYTPVYMCLAGADLKQYEKSLKKIQSLSEDYDELYTGHEAGPVPKALLSDYLELCKRCFNQTAEWEDALYFDQFPCKRYFFKKASILLLD